jgi:hypothetical protein
MQPPALRERGTACRQDLLGRRVHIDRDPAGRVRGPVVGGACGLAKFGRGAGNCPVLAQAGQVGEHLQPDEQGECLVDGQSQRPGDRVGVADVHPPGLPLGLDQVVR